MRLFDAIKSWFKPKETTAQQDEPMSKFADDAALDIAKHEEVATFVTLPTGRTAKVDGQGNFVGWL